MTTAITIGIFGQSFALALTQEPALSVFKSEIKTAGGYSSVDIVSHVSDGSAALFENAPSAYPNRYWWNPAGANETAKIGPELATAKSVIIASSNKPEIILWLQGEGDSSGSLPDAAEIARFKDATTQVIWRLKLASNPGDPSSIPTLTHRIGRRINSNGAPGVQAIREAQIAVDASSPTLHFLCDNWDLALMGDDPLGRWPNNSHMTPVGNAILGWRAAHRVLQQIGKPHLAGPVLSSVARVAVNTFDLTFSVSSPLALDLPSSVPHMAIRDGASLYEQDDLTFTWLGATTLRVVAPASVPGGALLLYPEGSLHDIDRSGLIKDSAGTIVRSFAHSLPA